MAAVGGRISITLNGRRYSPRGKATIRPAGVTNTAGVNSDNTMFTTRAPLLAGADITFDRGSASNGSARPKWDTAFMTGSYDVSIREIDTGVTHIFAEATINGAPSIDTESGEVSGLSIACSADNYRQI